MRRTFGLILAGLLMGVLAFGLPACGGDDTNDGSDGGSGTDGGGSGSDGGGSVTDGGGSGTDGGGGGADLPICDEVNVTGTRVAPNLLLVLDKSGSMDDPISSSSGRTKMEDLQEAVDSLLTQGEGEIKFGLMAYPHCNNCTQYSCPCACDPGQIDEPVGSTVNSIRSTVNSLPSAGGTPTGTSLQAADSYFQSYGGEGENFIVLVTDGMPTCPNGEGYNVTQADINLSLSAVEDLKSHGTDTFVIGLGEDLEYVDPELLNDMAEAGGWPQAGATKYYQANSVEALQQVLATIGGLILSCDMSLDIVPEFPAWLWIWFDDVQVPRDTDHANGWDYDAANNMIHFYGTYCDQLRNGDVESVEIKAGCAPPD